MSRLIINNLLSPDTRWAMQRINFLEEYEDRFIAPIYLLDQVHEDIHKRIENVRRIVRYAYFEYELLDIAYEHLFLTLELALRLRYEELEGLPARKNRRTMKPLLDWAGRKNQLEFPERSKSLEHLRNSGAHPMQYSMAGIAGVSLLYSIPDVKFGEFRTAFRRVSDTFGGCSGMILKIPLANV